MALKTKVETEAQHLLLAGTKDDLNTQISGYLNAGWTILEARMLSYDSYNFILQVFYIIVRNKDA